MLIRITTQSSKHTVVASTRDKTTLEGLDILCNLYEHMLHLQEARGYVYNNLDTVVEAVWDYIRCYEGTTQHWEVSCDSTTIGDLAAVNSCGEAAPWQVSSIRFTLDQDNKINQSETVFSADSMFYEDFHFNGPAEDEDGYREEPEVLHGVLIDELDELTHEELKHLRDKVYHQPNQVMWVYDFGGGTYQSTRL